MRVFYDFEFWEDGSNLQPISVGLVDEVGHTFHGVLEEIEIGVAEDGPYERIAHQHWLMTNVVPLLPLRKDSRGRPMVDVAGHSFHLDDTSNEVMPRRMVRNAVRQFLQQASQDDQELQLWADCGAYDHVALMQLCWGKMTNKPDWAPWFTHDLRQFGGHLGVSIDAIPTEIIDPPHHALRDALRHREQWEYLRTHQINQSGGMPSRLPDGRLVERSLDFGFGVPEPEPEPIQICGDEEGDGRVCVLPMGHGVTDPPGKGRSHDYQVVCPDCGWRRGW